jgi:pimeloyl-ACP methyl ester carboxylesterase
MEIRQRSLRTNGIDMHVAECGTGPLVLLCHGWPELGYSWRHQLRALGEAGYHAVAPDMRGYGQTSAPADIQAYSIFHLVGDMVGLVSALAERSCAIVGHDWGAPVAWHAALMRPDLFKAVVGMSVPLRERTRAYPVQLLRERGLHRYYWVYFQEPGVAEANFERDITLTFRRLLFTASGDGPLDRKSWLVAQDAGLIEQMNEPAALPAWLRESDIDAYAREFTRTGFRGGLNWYRNIDRNWELTAPYQDARIEQPALFLAGTREPMLEGRRGQVSLDEMARLVPRLRVQRIEGAGHWLQQERPAEVNDALLAFLSSVATTL